MTAMLVLIHARKVRSLARYSVARFASSTVAWFSCFCIRSRRNQGSNDVRVSSCFPTKCSTTKEKYGAGFIKRKGFAIFNGESDVWTYPLAFGHNWRHRFFLFKLVAHLLDLCCLRFEGGS